MLWAQSLSITREVVAALNQVCGMLNIVIYSDEPLCF